MNEPPATPDRAELDLLIDRVIEQTLSEADADRLDALLRQSLEALQRYRQSIDTHRALCELFPTGILEETLRHEAESWEPGKLLLTEVSGRPGPAAVSRFTQLAAVLIVSGLVGGISYTIGRRDSQPPPPSTTVAEESGVSTNPPGSRRTPAEATLAGHGILRQTLDIVWPDGTSQRPAGSLLQPGELSFEAGIAVIDFFSGATLVVEGPARLEVVSDWAVTVHQGRLEATVPPAAQGFVIRTADAEIIDLGTQFALEVSQNKAQVAVLDGEVMLRGKRFADDRLLTGAQATLGAEPLEPDFVSSIPRLAEIDSRGENESRRRFERAVGFVEELADDPRLISGYSALKTDPARRLVNLATRGLASDAQLVGPVEIVPGRFPGQSHGLNFSRPGSRGRVKIDGSFTAYTFACWAKIDSLRHTYNALFLADGYENGEPHWQIRHDGRLMFSVMVDDSREVISRRPPGRPPVRDAGWHRVYFTEPVWDASMTGRWIHLAAVYDPARRLVTQYLDGEAVSREQITDDYFIADLRIGAGEIGNWGQPFRKTPDFAVRNLDGVIDEMFLFNAAVTDAEIRTMFQQGSPQ